MNELKISNNIWDLFCDFDSNQKAIGYNKNIFFWFLENILNKNIKTIKNDFYFNNLRLSFVQICILNLYIKASMVIPWQYVLEKCIFMNNWYKIQYNEFIPREDTEQILKILLEHKTLKKVQIIEFGSGIGAVCSEIQNIFNNLIYYGIEINESSIELFKKNVNYKNRSQLIKIIKNNWTYNLKQFPDKFDFIISNPPYVLLEETISSCESAVALYGNKYNILDYYYELFDFITINLKESGSAIIECNKKIYNMIKNKLLKYNFNHKVIHDINSKIRVIYLKIK